MDGVFALLELPPSPLETAMAATSAVGGEGEEEAADCFSAGGEVVVSGSVSPSGGTRGVSPSAMAAQTKGKTLNCR